MPYQKPLRRASVLDLRNLSQEFYSVLMQRGSQRAAPGWVVRDPLCNDLHIPEMSFRKCSEVRAGWERGRDLSDHVAIHSM